MCSDLAIRAGTAARLSPQNYNRERGELTFRTKFENAQTLPVTDALRVLLDSTLAAGDTARPFVHLLHPHGRVGYTGLLKAFHQRCEQAGITRRITPHDLRRTTAVQTYEITGDLRVVQALLGHRSLETTFHYLDHRNTPVPRRTLEMAKLHTKKATA
jgi:integrase